MLQGPSWSYGSWIYNYLYATMPITTKVVSSNATHDEMYSIQHYVIKFVSDLWQVAGFLHQYDWPPRYSWNIVESGVKHHNPHNLSIVYCIREIQIGFSLYKLFIGKFCAKYRYRCISIYIIPQVHLLVQSICSLYQYSSRNIYVQYAFEENLLLIWTFPFFLWSHWVLSSVSTDFLWWWWILSVSDVMMLLIKTITSVLKVLTYINTSITARDIGLAVILVIR